MSNRLIKIGTLILVSHLLLIFFSVFNKVLVNYTKRVITDKGKRLTRLWVSLFQQYELTVLFYATFAFVYRVAGRVPNLYVHPPDH